MSDRSLHDPTRDTILELIEAEQDGTKRAHLMIMLRILDSLEKVSITALKIETELSVHKLEFDEYKVKFSTFEKSGNELINKGKGAIWSAVVFIGMIQGLLVYQFSTLADTLKDLGGSVQQNTTNIAVLKSLPHNGGPISPGNILSRPSYK